MFSGLGSPTHLLLVLVVILLVFGAKRLPEMGRSLGQGLQEFKDGLSTDEKPPEQEIPSSEAVEKVQGEGQKRKGDTKRNDTSH